MARSDVEPTKSTVIEHHLVQPQGIPVLLRRTIGSEPAPAVIMLHGWGGSKERFSRMLSLDDRFVAAYLDLPGHGERPPISEGPEGVRRMVVDTVQNAAEEISTIIDFLRTRPEVDEARIGICGWSLGGFAALLALTQNLGFKAGAAISAPHSARLVHQ